MEEQKTEKRNLFQRTWAFLDEHRFALLGIIAALLVVLFIGFYHMTSAAEQAKVVSQIQVAVTALPNTLDPAENTVNQTETVMQHLFENLLRQVQDEEGNIVLQGAQAESYDMEENFDGTITYTFQLRRNAKWSDGRGVTAMDFVYAWRRLANPANQYSCAAFYMDMIQGYDEAVAEEDYTKMAVSAADEHTLVVVLKGRCNYFLTDTCTSAATMPLRSDQADGWTTDADKLVTNGAYRLTEWKNGQSMTLTKSDTYYNQDQVGPGQILFCRYSSAEQAWEEYQAQKIDFVLDLPNSVLKDFTVSQLSRKEEGEWGVGAYISAYTVLFNHQAEGFSDALVRQAFSLAIDREALVQALGGARLPATGLVPYGVSDDAGKGDFRSNGGDLFTNSAEAYRQAKEAAQILLRKVGYSDGSTFPKVQYCYCNTSQEATVARLLQTMWRNVLGVTVELKAVEPEEWEDFLKDGNFYLAGYEMTAPYDDASFFLDPWGTQQKENYMHYSNQSYDLLLSAAEHFTMEGTHSVYLHEAEEVLIQDSALIPLYFNTSSYAANARLSGVYYDTEGHYYFYNVKVKE